MAAGCPNCKKSSAPSKAATGGNPAVAAVKALLGKQGAQGVQGKAATVRRVKAKAAASE